MISAMKEMLSWLLLMLMIATGSQASLLSNVKLEDLNHYEVIDAIGDVLSVLSEKTKDRDVASHAKHREFSFKGSFFDYSSFEIALRYVCILFGNY